MKTNKKTPAREFTRRSNQKQRDDLTQAKLQQLLDYDPHTGSFRWKKSFKHGQAKIHTIAGSTGFYGYRHITLQGLSYRAHRLAWLYIYGHWPTEVIDHINHIRDDNRIINLREATAFQNQWNKMYACNNTSGYKGVSWCNQKKMWRAQIMFNNKSKHLGHFRTSVQAAEVYKTAAEKLFGEFAHVV